jgi:hypothetical protein
VQPRNNGFVVEGKKRVAKANPILEESPAIKKVFLKRFFSYTSSDGFDPYITANILNRLQDQ